MASGPLPPCLPDPHAGDTVLIIDREARPIPVNPMERDTALATDFLQQMREAGAEVDPGRIPQGEAGVRVGGGG